MSPLDDWLYMSVAIVGLTAVTFACRASFFMLRPSVELPARVEQALRFAPACALVAIIAPEVFTQDGEVLLRADNHQMWALLAGSLVFLKYRSMLVMVSVGMAVFTLLRVFA
jgi:branched-subunit amino acid transport protein